MTGSETMAEQECDFSWIAKAVSDAMAISARENQNIPRAEKKFGGIFSGLAKKAPLRKDTLTDEEKDVVDALSEPAYGPLFYEVDGTIYYKSKVGESAVIYYVENSEGALAAAKEVQQECWKRGCHATRIPTSSEDKRKRCAISPDDALFEFSKTALALIRGVDVSISIGDEEDPSWSKGIEKKLAFGARASKARYKEYETSAVRSALLGMPVVKPSYFVDREKYFSVFYSSLKETFSERMIENVNYYGQKLKDKSKIRITAGDGTDLVFSIKGRAVLRDDAAPPANKTETHHYNFPAGEIFLAPVETSAEGAIIFDYVVPSGFGLIRDLRIVFKKGRVADFSARDDGAERFKKFLDSNTGDKDRIAELGIGCNPGADFIGTTIVDEKIFGSIHIAIGWNRGPYKGKNQASSHQDMIKIMKGKNGNMYADGEIIMKDGMPVR